ncbi:1-phosphofructokinase family hexose kinase [Curtobacterium sp. Leaf261]|uniref:1-phosphofructokinase family hexose kinase n=1 Tax=Curtobacterium sp. Leaf261 TaxID=1736311 RepID=UPI0006F44764|nr:hexose kinase [Curtobacterium sp. Leaf261]KQO64402.1 1-phosphofructokinase [Curtobacterium sp. Leaf261]
MAAVVVITPNPAIDVTYRVAEQRIGSTQRVTETIRTPGGKGINVVRVLASLGVDALSLAPLGGASGTWMSEALDRLGIAHLDAPIQAETRSTVTVVDDHAHPTMFGEAGPMVSAAEWEHLDAMLAAALDGADVLVVSGSLPHGADPSLVGRWIRIAHEHGVLTVVDVSGPALLAAADAGASILKPNREELAEATGMPSEEQGAAALIARGAGTVVVSRGADGIGAHTPTGDVITVPPVPGIVGNPTGAGDAATAGLVDAIVGGADLESALRRAAAAGAAAVLRPVAGEIELAAFTRFHSAPIPPGGPA